ncbi:MAG TPA: dihydropyrimidinase, partial [Alphaproteobacteria bacterium]|nr:dihydropyrimidinase [Alphaproteobacteria bacterium]
MSQQIDLVIRQAQIVTPEGVVEGDLGVDGGRITSVGTPVPAARRVIEAPGRLIMPGGVDVHA